MAEALIAGLLAGDSLSPSEILASDVSRERRDYICEKYGVSTTADNLLASRSADYVLLAVKPQHFEETAGPLRAEMTRGKKVISIAAGITIDRIRSLIGPDPIIIRVMPNAPALVNQGISAIVWPPDIDDRDSGFINRIFESAGKVVRVNEAEIDAVTAVSGSGPAYFYLLVRELAAAGVEMGLDEAMARDLARQTFIGAGLLLDQAGATEDELIEAVASPGGTTEAALRSFEQDGIDETVRRAVSAAVARARELSG